MISNILQSYWALLPVGVLTFLAMRFFMKSTQRTAQEEARSAVRLALETTNRRIEVKVVGQDALPWPSTLGHGATHGFLVMRFDSGSGWIREDCFTGADAYINAFNRAAKLREHMEDNLRTEIRARRRNSPDMSGFVVKPREIFILPVVMLATEVDVASVESVN